MRYEWDPDKAVTNLAKHGVDFQDAIPALRDPNRIEKLDDRFNYGEDRVQVIGMSRSGILFVVTTPRGRPLGSVTRILSARKATRHEQDEYFFG